MATEDHSLGYAGDLSAADAWALLSGNPVAEMVDVRTLAEWSFVGIPDLTGLDRKVHCVEWEIFPSKARNPFFLEQTEAALDGRKDAPVLVLCRSGVRSRAAAAAMTQAGYAQAYNVADGFEGDLDHNSRRGSKNGWKAAGLPWKQS